MRVSPRELKAVRANGIVTRYAALGEAVVIIADLPDAGSAGTSLETPCELEHWGVVLQGSLSLESNGRHSFAAGTAFYVPPGPPTHHFTTRRRSVVAGFAPLSEPFDDTPTALRARGIEVIRRSPAPFAVPETVRIKGSPARRTSVGQIETDSAAMGAWLFTRTTFGPLSGYTDGWCDLPHWGLVLGGDLVTRWEDGALELLGPGDVFHTPAGPPGHRFEVADVATMIDYTPLSAIDDEGRRRAPRTVVARAAGRRSRASRVPETAAPARSRTARRSAPDDVLGSGSV